ncbi:MAG TPA: glycosyltransferase [Dehalococcoidia bacterium]
MAILGGDVYFAVSGDGVRDYSLRFTQALQESGLARADLFWWSRSGDWTKMPDDPDASPSAVSRQVWRGLRTYDAVIVQYDVFRFGRRGFVPWLPARLLWLKHSAPGLTIGVMLHELHLPFHTWRWEMKKAWQRIQHVGFRLAADVLFASVEPWVAELGARRPRRPAVHLPVGSNLPDRRQAREAVRTQLGANEHTVVLCAFGTDDSPWRLYEYTAHAVNRVARSGRRVLFLNLGGNTPELRGLDAGIPAIRPGFIPADALAGMIAASDIFLAPFADGISTRRTTVMAAFQQGTAVLGTWGSHTDRILRMAPESVCLTPVGDPAAFAAEAVALAADPERRHALGTAARRLYERSFDWTVIASRAVQALGLATAQATRATAPLIPYRGAAMTIPRESAPPGPGSLR